MAVQPAILVIDDEIRSQELLRHTLEEDFAVFTIQRVRRAVMERELVQVVLCDQRMLVAHGQVTQDG
jgi:two-component system response regulator HupR/HoxA